MFFVRKAVPAEASILPAIERSAAAVFGTIAELAWLFDGDAMAAERHADLISGGAEWVASDEAGNLIGFLAAEVIGTTLHIWEIAVVPDVQGQGIGRALVSSAVEWAAGKGLAAVTLTTFRRVPWNEPFYQTCDFETLEVPDVSPGLRAILDAEVIAGLPGERRCAMRRRLRPPESVIKAGATHPPSSSQFRIRWSTPADHPTLAAVLFSSVRDGPSAYTEAERAEWAPAPQSGSEWSERLLAQDVVVAENDDGPVGFMSLAADGYIDLAFLLTSARGRGLFGRMFAGIERRSRERGDDRMWTHASLMARFPFEAAGFYTRERQLVALGDERLERFVMERRFSSHFERE